MYEGDAPLAERRAQALALDRELLAELLGEEELRELLDPAAIADLELELQALPAAVGCARSTASTTCCAGSATCAPTRSRRARDLPDVEVAAARGAASATGASCRCASAARSAGSRSRTWPATATPFGASPPPGVAETLARRPTRRDAAARRAAAALGAHPRAVHGRGAGGALGHRAVRALDERLRALVGAGALLEGAFRPGGTEHEFADAEVLRSLRRRSLARLRREVEPVPSRRPSAASCPPGTASARRPPATTGCSR